VRAAVSRDTRIDALKGLAIVAVVLYHTMGQYLITAPTLALYLREIMYSFMLPLFAFLSGYVLGKRRPFRPRSYFVRRTMGLMVPYLCWELIYGLAMRHDARRGVGAFGIYLADTLLNPHLEGRMWYLYVLWLALMALGILRLFGDRTWVLAAAIGVSAFWPWWGNFQRLQWIFVYVVIGLLVRRYEPHVLPRIKAIGLVGAALYLPFLLASHPEELAVARAHTYLGGVTWPGLAPALVHTGSTVTGLAAVAAVVAASYFAPSGLERALALPGRLSLGIYVTHFAVVETWHDPSPWLIPVIVGLALVLSMAATALLGRWRVTATLLLGERWTPKSLPLGDVHTETI
jgi:fucose 4-O-acetylase-like acetyltransferase